MSPDIVLVVGHHVAPSRDCVVAGFFGVPAWFNGLIFWGFAPAITWIFTLVRALGTQQTGSMWATLITQEAVPFRRPVAIGHKVG